MTTRAEITRKIVADMGLKEPVYVSRPSLPPVDRVKILVDSIWQSGQVTNCGQYLQEFEARVGEYLKARFVNAVVNGHSALEASLRALNLSGEVITTPFTFPSTAHAISSCNLEPVFVDIESNTYNIDVTKIEEKITISTSAILAVHVFGNPANVEALQDLSDRYDLKLVFDAAHAFGVEHSGKGIAEFGDASAFSLHATKVFSTVEGGIVASKSEEHQNIVSRIRNFGFPLGSSDEDIGIIGSNFKMNEISAAVGVLNLESIDTNISRRKEVYNLYCERLSGVPGLSVTNMIASKPNYAYCPILVSEQDFGMSRDAVINGLVACNIHARKYFWPLCSNLKCYQENRSASYPLPMSEQVSSQVICLPMYPTIGADIVEKICAVLSALASVGK